MDLGIRGRTAIVCASSQGLGKACARALAEAGVSLVINGRDGTRLAQAAEEIRRAADAGTQDDAESYFSAALRALERLAIQRGLVGPQELTSMRQAWTEAYESTPHGQPVRLP